MDTLPIELLGHIAQRCDHASQKALRLTNRTLKQIATPTVFEHLYLALQQDSLLKLSNIARSSSTHTGLARHVRQMTFYCEALPYFDTLEDYANKVDQSPDFVQWLGPQRSRGDEGDRSILNTDGGFSLSVQDLEAGWEAYKRLWNQQQEWVMNNEGLAFIDLIVMLPNLTDVNTICTWDASYGGEWAWPLWKRLHSSIFLCPADWTLDPDIFDEDFHAPASVKAIATLLEGVAARSSCSGCRPITKLHLSSICQGSLQSLRGTAYNDTFHFDVDRLATGFQNLIDLSIELRKVNNRPAHDQSLDELTILLKNAPKLWRLRLFVDRCGFSDFEPNREYQPLARLFSSNTAVWPVIRSLSLSVDVSCHALLNFLGAHSSTLEELTLEDMIVGDVAHLIERLPKVVKLRKVFIQELYRSLDNSDTAKPAGLLNYFTQGTDHDAPYETAVQTYLLRLTETLPDFVQHRLSYPKAMAAGV